MGSTIAVDLQRKADTDPLKTAGTTKLQALLFRKFCIAHRKRLRRESYLLVAKNCQEQSRLYREVCAVNCQL